MFRRVFFGEVTHEENRTLPDLNRRELAAILPLAALAVLLGLFPGALLASITKSSQPLVQTLDQAGERRAVQEVEARLVAPGLELASAARSADGGAQ
jgi:NADH-quinone oxidoreductase subunit M